MRVAVSGTPGTGKTAATDRIATDFDVIHLNELIRDKGLVRGSDPDRDTLIADIDAVEERVAGLDSVVIESHLAHRLDVDRVIILRCHPEQLGRRLRERGEPAPTVEENVECEALDIILAEAVDRHPTESVFEVDTTDRTPEEVADEIDEIIAGEREPRVGTVSFIDYL